MGLVAAVLVLALAGSGVTRWLNVSLGEWDSTIDKLDRPRPGREGRS